MTFIGSVATVGGYTFLSRVLGFARDMMMASIIGAGPIFDAFIVAFKFPNFFRRLFAEGAFNAAFVPSFSELYHNEGAARAQLFASRVFSLMFIFLSLFVIVVELLMPTVMKFFAAGFIRTPERFELTVQLAKITFPYILLISLTALFSGVLNTMGRFAAAAAAPILLNMCLIAALVGSYFFVYPLGHMVSVAVTTSGVLQLLLVIGACWAAGLKIRFVWPTLTPQVRKLFSLFVPGVMGAGIVQLNIFIGTIISTWLPTGAITYVFLADRVNQFPLGVMGAAIGTALLPMLSKKIQQEDQESILSAQKESLEFALYFAFPAAVALMIIAFPICTVLFQRGVYGMEDTIATAMTLKAFAVGLPAYVLIKVLGTSYFARKDTTTPVVYGAICMVVNVVFTIIFMNLYAHVGIALATSLSSWVNVVLLGYGLYKKGLISIRKTILEFMPRLLLCCTLMGGILYSVYIQVAPHFYAGEVRRAAFLMLLITTGLVSYLIGSQLLSIGPLKRYADLQKI